MRWLIVVLLSGLVLASCTSRKEVKQVRLVKEGDEALTCEQIEAEALANYRQMLRAEGNLGTAGERNAANRGAHIAGALLGGIMVGAAPGNAAFVDRDLLRNYAWRDQRLRQYAEAKDCPPLQPLPQHLVQTLQDQGIVQPAAAQSADPASPLQGE